MAKLWTTQICTGHPVWEKLETPAHSYSKAIIELTKSMLVKQPDERPLVKVPIRSYISNVLAFVSIQYLLCSFSADIFTMINLGNG